MRRSPGGRQRLGSLLVAISPLFGGCASDPLPNTAPASVTAEVSSNVGTVVSVTWKTSTPTIGYVSYGTTRDLGQTAPLEEVSTTDHSRALLGLSPDTTYYYRVISWDIGNVTAGASDVQSFHTKPLPAGSPTVSVQSFEVTDDKGEIDKPMEDFVIVPFAGTDFTTVGIVDPTGGLVWSHVEERLGRRVTRARVSGDGTAVLYSSVSDDSPEDSEIVRVALDGSATSSVSVPGLGEDFAVHTDGTLALLERETSGSTIGDRIVELDASGTATTVFTTFDCFDPSESPGDGASGVWSGASALQVDSKRNLYYVALRNLNTIISVDRETGECGWILGDDAAGTLAYADGSSPFAHPGSFYADTGKLIVLDADGAGGGSRMVSYDLELDDMTATETQSYASNPTIDVTQHGEATIVTGGAVLVNWSNGSRMDVVNEAGNVKWTLSASSGESLGYHTAFRDIYNVKLEGNQ